MTYGVSGDRHLASSYQYCYGKHLITDRRSGRILEWSLSVNAEAGEVIQRRRIIPNINGSLLKTPGNKLQLSTVEVQMQQGLGLAGSVQGSDPILMLEVSSDGGQTWDTIHNIRTGEAGEFSHKIKADHLTSFYDGVVRITQSDPTPFNIRGLFVHIKPIGDY